MSAPVAGIRIKGARALNLTSPYATSGHPSLSFLFSLPVSSCLQNMRTWLRLEKMTFTA